MKTRQLLFLMIFIFNAFLNTGFGQVTQATNAVSDANSFIGTSNNFNLIFKRGGVFSGIIQNGAATATNFVTGGTTSFGFNSMSSLTAYGNAAFGSYALNANQTGQLNAAFGNAALLKNISGGYNTSVGTSALSNNLYADLNVAVGERALFNNIGDASNNTLGSQNVAIGARSLFGNTVGYANVGIGYNSLSGNTNGYNNVAIGKNSLDVVNGSSNIGIGAATGNSLTNGNSNIFIGDNSGQGISNGNNNTFIGRVSVPLAAKTPLSIGSDTNGTIILANGLGNQRLLINDINGYTGIGLGNNVIPENRLHIGTGISGTSGLRFKGLNSSNIGLPNIALPINNKFLTLNSAGDVILQNLPAGSSGTVSIANGTNTTVTGTGVSPTPYIINAKNIYTDNGSLTGTRTVTMGNNNLIFSSNGSTSGNGRVYIGDTVLFPAITATSNYRLLVEGGILTEKVKVALRSSTNWADYVFASDYKLKPLKEVETFIKENKHLPGISSANELVKEGIDIADMQAKQMEKIEELTLYAIEQNKQIEKQNKDIEELKAIVKTLLEKK